jgi:hypothetical protein
MNHQTKNKIKEVFKWLFIFVVGSLIVSFILQPDSFQSLKNNVNNLISVIKDKVIINEDPLISQCRESFNRCKNIAETKIDGMTLSLINIEKFHNEASALEFYNTWSSLSSGKSTKLPDGVNLPVVLIAFKIGGSTGSMSMVKDCDGSKMELNLLGLNFC